MSRLLALQENIQSTDTMITQLERTLTLDAPRSAWANLRSLESRREMLEQEFFALADRHSRDVLSYRMFNPADRYKVSGYAKALAEFQNAFALTFDALKNGPKLRATISPEVEAATSFDFAYAFSGSVGVVMTLENERTLLAGTLLDDAIALVFETIKSETSSQVAEFAKTIGPPPIRALYKWSSAHLSAGMGARIEWRKNIEVTSSLLVQQPELERLRTAIAAVSDVEVLRFPVRGELLAWDIPAKRFRMRTFDGEEMAGSVADEALPQGESVEIPSLRSAIVERRSKIHYSTEKEDRTWKLLSLGDDKENEG